MSIGETQTVDAAARVVLPARFAASSVVVQEISENEVRIRKTIADLEEDAVFLEESRTVLSDRDRDRFLELLDNPPAPNEALRKLFADHRKRDD